MKAARRNILVRGFDSRITPDFNRHTNKKEKDASRQKQENATAEESKL